MAYPMPNNANPERMCSGKNNQSNARITGSLYKSGTHRFKYPTRSPPWEWNANQNMWLQMPPSCGECGSPSWSL